MSATMMVVTEYQLDPASLLTEAEDCNSLIPIPALPMLEMIWPVWSAVILQKDLGEADLRRRHSRCETQQ
jgi:hypothetical protein